MGIWERISRIFRANVNDAISKAEDPEKILNQLILDMQKQLVDAKKQVAVAIADEKRLRKQVDKEFGLAEEWKGKAMQAVKAQRDDLAKQALARHKQHAGLAAELDQQWQKQKAATDQLKATLQQLNNKIEEAKRKKGLLIARSRRADAQKQIQATMHGLAESSAFDTFAKMEERVEAKEAEADAQTELSEQITGDALARQFDSLESSAGDDELAALKAEMGVGAPVAEAGPTDGASAPAALPPAQEGAVDELEAELAALKAKAAAPAGGPGPGAGA